MIKDVNGRFDDYAISPMIGQVLLHWGYELVESDLQWFIFYSFEISYYQLTKDKFLKKGKDRYQNRGGKQEAAKYYEDNQEVLRKSEKSV